MVIHVLLGTMNNDQYRYACMEATGKLPNGRKTPSIIIIIQEKIAFLYCIINIIDHISMEIFSILSLKLGRRQKTEESCSVSLSQITLNMKSLQ